MGMKVFKDQKSLLVLLLEGQHFSGFWNIMLIQYGLLAVALVSKDFINYGYIDLSREAQLFGGPEDWLRFTILETLQISGALLVYPAFILWQRVRKMTGPIADLIFVLACLATIVVSMVTVFKALTLLDLPPVFRSLSTIENMRLVMKSYSFIRENVAKVLKPWHKDDKDGPPVWYKGQMDPSVGSFNKYFYFLFAPTLLYRDHYPRMKGPIRWTKAALYLGQFLGMTYVQYLIFSKWLFPSSFTLKDVSNTCQLILLFSPFGVFNAKMILFHTWHNFTAELTRFADREFYSDWWNSSSYPVFYRKWNILIYDWIKVYFFQDLRKVLKNSWLAALVVFCVSAFMHDYHIAVCTGYFLPAFMVLFTGAGGFMFLVRPDENNRFAKAFTMWGFYVGTTIILSLHYTELSARTHCPQSNRSFLQFAALDCFQTVNGTM